MSAFTPDEIEYLQSQTLGRLATVGTGDQPHVIPVTFRFNEDEDSIDVGGIDFASGKKWRDAQHNPNHWRRHDEPEVSELRPRVLPNPPDAYRELGS